MEVAGRLADSLHVERPDDQALLRRAVISSKVRLRKYQLASLDFHKKRWVRLAKLPIGLVFAFLALASISLLMGEMKFNESLLSFFVTGAFVVGVVVLPTVWNHYSSFDARVGRVIGEKGAHRLLGILVVDLAFLLFGVAFMVRQLRLDESDSLLISPALVLYLCAMLMVNDWLSDSIITLFIFPRRHRVRPLDRTLIDILQVARYADLWKGNWYDAARSRSLVSELEAVARRVETVAWRTHRVGLLDRRARSEYRRDLLALAFAIREQKKILVRANNASGFSAVHSSLVRLAILLVKNEWGVIEESTGVSLVSRFLLVWRKVFPSACLVLGAFAIPYLPGVKESADLMLSARVMLLATAVLHLALPADSPAAGKLLEVLGRSLK